MKQPMNAPVLHPSHTNITSRNDKLLRFHTQKVLVVAVYVDDITDMSDSSCACGACYRL